LKTEADLASEMVWFCQPQKMDNFQNFSPSYDHIPSSEFFKAQLRQNLAQS